MNKMSRFHFFFFPHKFILFFIIFYFLTSAKRVYPFKAYDPLCPPSPVAQQKNGSHLIVSYYPGYINDQVDASKLPWNVTHLNWIGV